MMATPFYKWPSADKHSATPTDCPEANKRMIKLIDDERIRLAQGRFIWMWAAIAFFAVSILGLIT